MRINEINLFEKPVDVQQLAKSVSALDPKTQKKVIARVANALELAQEENPTRSALNQLKKVDDPDMLKGYYKAAAKMLVGNSVPPEEINKLVQAINKDQCILLGELKKPFNTLDKIIPLYARGSMELKKYFTDMIMYQPGQGLGPGEILFAIHSRELSKKGKGDLTIVPDGDLIEVKGGASAGRFTDRDFGVSPDTINIARDFEKKFGKIIPYQGSTGSNYAEIIKALQDPANEKFTADILGFLQRSLQSYFGDSKYIPKIMAQVQRGNEKATRQLHAYANMEAYFGTKGGAKEGILFIQTRSQPPVTAYADSVESLKKGADLTVSTIYPISHAAAGPFPKIGAVPNS